MTKVKLKDATKELATGAGAVLNDATRVRKSADTLMQSLRKLEVKFTREEEERVAKEKREAQEKLLSSHSKAFTMPDDDEPQSAPVPSPPRPRLRPSLRRRPRRRSLLKSLSRKSRRLRRRIPSPPRSPLRRLRRPSSPPRRSL